MPHDWYAVFTNPRCELEVDYYLTAAGADVFMPRIGLSRGRHQGGRAIKSLVNRSPCVSILPLFPRYVFARGLPPSIIRYTRGVSDLVRSGGERDPATDLLLPTLVPEAVVDRIRSKLDEHDILRPEARSAPFHIGEQISVTYGPLQGLISHITGIDNSSEVKIWCGMFGGAHVSVPRKSVERLPTSEAQCGRISKSAA